MQDFSLQKDSLETRLTELEAKRPELKQRSQSLDELQRQLDERDAKSSQELSEQWGNLNSRIEELDQYAIQLADQEEDIKTGRAQLIELMADNKKDKTYLAEKIKAAETLMQEADMRLEAATKIEQKNINERKVIEGRHADLKKIEQGLRKKEIVLQEKEDFIINRR
jgi:chromosome segregation ATPase